MESQHCIWTGASLHGKNRCTRNTLRFIDLSHSLPRKRAANPEKHNCQAKTVATKFNEKHRQNLQGLLGEEDLGSTRWHSLQDGRKAKVHKVTLSLLCVLFTALSQHTICLYSFAYLLLGLVLCNKAIREKPCGGNIHSLLKIYFLMLGVITL